MVLNMVMLFLELISNMLSKCLFTIFIMNGSVTAGNSSQMSDGAAFVLIMSEKMVKELNVEPIEDV